MDTLETLLGRDPRFLAGSLVAVFGSGGKTALLGHLARELSRHHRRVLVSTGTKVYPFPGLPLVESVDDLPAALAEHPAVVLGRRVAEGKLAAPDDVPLARLGDHADLLLLECDGARGFPLKVHLPHDPKLPAGCRLAFMLVGASALAAGSCRDALHRADRAPDHWGLRIDEALTPEAVRRVLLSPRGYLGKAGRVPLRILVNQADAHPRAAEALAASLAERWAGNLLVGSVHQRQFREIRRPLPRAALILAAAGRGERFGEDKRRFSLKGHSLLRWSLSVYGRLPLLRRILVLGPESRDADLAAEAEAMGWQVTHNPEPEAGLSGSWRAGLESLPDDAAGAFLALADMPAPRPGTLSALLDAVAADPGRAARPRFEGKPGHPVYLPRTALEELASQEGDRGARNLLPGLNPFPLDTDDPGVILDLDRPDQAAALAALLPEEPEIHAV